MAEGNTKYPHGDSDSAAAPSGRRPANLLTERRFPVGLAWGFYAAMAAIALLWRGFWDGQLPWSVPGASPLPLAVRIVAGVVVGLAAVGASRWWIGQSERASRLSEELGRMLGPMSASAAWGLALASGVGEELLFRGAAQPALGIVLASLLFAAVHYLPGPGLWIWSLYALAAGLVLGGLFEWTGDALAPVVAHAVLNGVNLNWLARENRARAGRS